MIQTDLTLSDLSNFEVYKDWYVNECWTAFAQFAKFRKEILKQVKDEYILKTKGKRGRQPTKQEGRKRKKNAA
jgi:hypothetical protein